MKKKQYIIPFTEVVNVHIQHHLLDGSITGVESEEGSDFTDPIETGGLTDDADSRGFFWDE